MRSLVILLLIFPKANPGANPTKLFTAVIYSFTVFVPGKPFQPGLLYVGKAKGLPEWSTFQVLHSVEKLFRNKHSSLLRKSVNYVRKKFIWLAPGQGNKTFFN
jgi:hypothetical protein